MLEKYSLSQPGIAQLLDFLPCPLLLAKARDGNLHTILINKTFVDEIGYTMEDMPTINEWWLLAYPDAAYREHVKTRWAEQSLQAMHEGSAEMNVKAKIQTKNQGKRWFDVKTSLGGTFQAVAFVDVDNLEHRNRQLSALNTAKDNLLSVLSHDVRGPLQRLEALMGMFEKNYLTAKELQEQLQNIREDVNYALQTIEDTMEWARTPKSDHHYKAQEIDLLALVRQIAKSHKYLFDRKEVELVVKGEYAQLLHDPEVIRILIRNLLTNAIKFTPRAGKVTVTLLPMENGAQLSISDTGTGMTADEIDQITNKNITSQPGTENETGSGVGLSIVQSLAKEHSIDLVITSEPKVGSTFSLIFTDSPEPTEPLPHTS